jgi:predicted acetyltransferase
MSLRLRPFTFDDEVPALAAQKDFEGDGLSFLAPYDVGQTWTQWLELIVGIEQRNNIPENYVPGVTLAADVDGELVGRVSVRYELNEYLANRGGHIGYAVLREYRRKGYATEMLRQALQFTNDAGVNPVLVACDDDNVGSAAVIERCGGALESIGPDADGIIYRRYWFST